MTGKRIGYIRVSSEDQNPNRQLENVQIDKRFVEYATAKNNDRPQLQMMLEYATEDDIVIVHSMDRLARNLKDLKKIVDSLVERNIQVQFIKENLTFGGKSDSAMAKLLLHIMGAFAEFEHAFILERMREGIAVAKKLGRYRIGKEFKIQGDRLEQLKHDLMTTRKSKIKLAEEYGVTRMTIYKYIQRLKKEGLVIHE